MFRFHLKSKHGTLLKNTLMLQILQLSTYVLALVAVPYETRVLGPEVYGILGVATAVMVYFQLVIDFGFLLSATEEVASNRDHKPILNQILTSVTISKMVLSILSAIVLFILCQFIDVWAEKKSLFFLFFLSTVCTSMMPDYLYRGLEQMTAITVRTVAIRGFFTVAIFVVLKKPEDLYCIPLLNIIGNGVAMLAAYYDLHKRFGIRFCKVGIHDVLGSVKRSSVFFYSRIATTAYTSLNTVILDVITASGGATGFYTAADKLIVTGKNLLTPISDSLYPYMVRNKDFKLVKKILMVLTPLIALFCGICFVWAEPICKILLGEEFGPAGQVLRAMLPVAVVTLPNYILGFPTLTAMGLKQYANYSVIFGSILHIMNLCILYFTGCMNMVTLAILVSVAEIAILLFRVFVIWKYRDRLGPKEDNNG